MKKKLRIGFEVQRLFRERRHGMEVVSFELLKELQQIDRHNDYTVYVRKDVNNDIIESNDNFEIKSLPARNYFSWEQIVLPKEASKDNLTFLHSTCNTSSIFDSIPKILTLHDIIYLEQFNFKGTAYQNFGNLYRKIVVPAIVKKSRKIITVSSFERDAIIKKFNLPEDKVVVIYNAVNSMFNRRLPIEKINSIKRSYNLPENYILFLGNTAPKKNSNLVIKAYADYVKANNDPQKMVILDYDKRLVTKRLSELRMLDCLDSFVFPGYIPPEVMPYVYSSCSLFLYPSLRESFGLPIIEAMACGVPVITSNTSSMPEIGGNAAEYVDPYSSRQLTDKMGLVLNNCTLQEEMRYKGLLRSQNFTWRASAEKLLEVYHTFL